MKNKDTKELLIFGEKLIAEEVQRFLESYEIYTLLLSDNPASSVMGSFMGSGMPETIRMYVNKDDYDKAIKVLNDSPYKELLNVE